MLPAEIWRQIADELNFPLSLASVSKYLRNALTKTVPYHEISRSHYHPVIRRLAKNTSRLYEIWVMKKGILTMYKRFNKREKVILQRRRGITVRFRRNGDIRSVVKPASSIRYGESYTKHCVVEKGKSKIINKYEVGISTTTYYNRYTLPEEYGDEFLLHFNNFKVMQVGRAASFWYYGQSGWLLTTVKT
nr:hypothetical protein K-LCC10_0359 [Kaumoebavirus]